MKNLATFLFLVPLLASAQKVQNEQTVTYTLTVPEFQEMLTDFLKKKKVNLPEKGVIINYSIGTLYEVCNNNTYKNTLVKYNVIIGIPREESPIPCNITLTYKLP